MNSRSYPVKGVPFAVLLIDLDHFKEINDKHGHDVGDQVLRAVANRMLQATRSYDTVARYGGDEFVILMTEQINPETAELKAARVLENVAQSVATSVGVISISCSIGVSLCPNHGRSLDTLLRKADQAMYSVKQVGRKGVALSDTPMGRALPINTGMQVAREGDRTSVRQPVPLE